MHTHTYSQTHACTTHMHHMHMQTHTLWIYGIYEMKPEQEGSANLLVKKVAQRDIRNILY